MTRPSNDNLEYDPVPVDLGDERLFSLPLCDRRVGLSVNDKFAVLEVTTICGKVVEIPFPTSVLQALHDLSGCALADLRRPMQANVAIRTLNEVPLS
jgi:hypothetical protein